MNDFTKLDWKITHVKLTEIKRMINYINLMKFPSFPSGCHKALSRAALCMHHYKF